MKKLIFCLALFLLAPSAAFAQCSGVGSANTVCAAPNGSSGFFAPRSLAAPDIPNALAGSSVTSIGPSGLICKNLTGLGTGADTTEDTLQTCTLAANAFDATGRCLKFDMWGSFGANGNTKTLRFYFGTAIFTSTGTPNNLNWYLWARICKTGSNAQTVVTAGIQGTTVLAPQTTAINQTDTASITMKITGQNGTASANDVVALAMIAKFEN